jgi:uncharacterized protein involved in type VI secretion and phage assembly
MSDSDLLDLFSDEEQRTTKATRTSGIVVGIVTSNKDEENCGRIKVTFPWHSDENESDYVRVSNFMAGNDRGSMFVPEVGDEVICAFLHGDINRPVCLGALHGIENKSPAKTDDGKNNIKIIKTRSGHTITFNDEDRKESLTIKSKSGHTISFEDTPGQEKLTIKDKTKNNFIEIDSVKNSITINSALMLDLKAPKINIEATGVMNIKASTMLKVEGLPIMLN